MNVVRTCIIDEKKYKPEETEMERFEWGVSTAAFQIEGAAREDGKKDSIWDVYTHEPGRTKMGDTGDTACDHYHRYKEDIRLMSELGVTAYRFSVSWPRVIPDGTGEVNEKGIRFYSDLVDEMLRYGIEPYMTLYHWDLPQALFERGGWLNPASPEWFYEYSRVMGERFGDRVKNFITVNEPSNVMNGLRPGGSNAPACPLTKREQLRALHNLLLAHGRSVMALRETVPDAKVGFAPCSTVFCPEDTGEDLVEAARRMYFFFDENCPTDNVIVYTDPVFLGDYPKVYYDNFSDIMPDITEKDLRIISTPVDCCFHNTYAGDIVVRDGKEGFRIKEGNPVRNSLSWKITPEALYWGPKFLYERYGKPVYITENGLPAPDVVCLDGKVHDAYRSDFIERYTRELLRAARDGVDVRGYFYWSFLDNLEWELGFEPRFGLVYIDFDTLERIPKDSFAYYRDLIRRYRGE